MNTTIKCMISSLIFGLLSACGGGGDGGSGTSGPVASTNSFNVQSGWQRYVTNGDSKTFTVSGSCTGTATATRGPATTATTFEGSPALSSVKVVSISLTNCTPASATSTGTEFFNTNYSPLGFSIQGGNYGVYQTPPVLPVAAKVGDAGILGSMAIYTSSNKSTSAGRLDGSYVIEPDTATTAIGNLIGKTYNTSNVLTSTEQDRYRIATDGSLTLISIDIQYANGSTTHLLLN